MCDCSLSQRCRICWDVRWPFRISKLAFIHKLEYIRCTRTIRSDSKYPSDSIEPAIHKNIPASHSKHKDYTLLHRLIEPTRCLRHILWVVESRVRAATGIRTCRRDCKTIMPQEMPAYERVKANGTRRGHVTRRMHQYLLTTAFRWCFSAIS